MGISTAKNNNVKTMSSFRINSFMKAMNAKSGREKGKERDQEEMTEEVGWGVVSSDTSFISNEV